MSGKKNNQGAITPLAVTNFRDIRKAFGIRQHNRQAHMYIVGQTGTGKSTLLQNMAVSDLRAGRGLGIIDPHGELAEEVLRRVPRRRVGDVIYFQPADLAYPVGYNPLGRVHPDRRHLVAAGLISVFKKVWLEFWGPRLEHILRQALLTLLEWPGSTLLDLPRLLTDREFRRRVTAGVRDPHVREFWSLEFEGYSAWLRSEAVSPILNKVGQFLASIPLRNIVGQRRNTFRLREVMDRGGILVLNLAKGRIGEDGCALLGALLATGFQLAALSRAELPAGRRRPFYLYVDEVHNFLTLSFADMLSEARKYGLHLVLAHQYIAQLDERLRAAILGNAGTVIAFRVGPEDAALLAREFRPAFGEEDLLRLPNHHIYLKLMIEGRPSRPFSAVTLPAPRARTSHRDEIVALSRRRYARPRREVERGLIRGSSAPDMPGTRRLPL